MFPRTKVNIFKVSTSRSPETHAKCLSIQIILLASWQTDFAPYTWCQNKKVRNFMGSRALTKMCVVILQLHIELKYFWSFFAGNLYRWRCPLMMIIMIWARWSVELSNLQQSTDSLIYRETHKGVEHLFVANFINLTPAVYWLIIICLILHFTITIKLQENKVVSCLLNAKKRLIHFLKTNCTYTASTMNLT